MRLWLEVIFSEWRVIGLVSLFVAAVLLAGAWVTAWGRADTLAAFASPRFVVVDVAPGGADIMRDTETGRCFLVPRSATGYRTPAIAPAEWCE